MSSRRAAAVLLGVGAAALAVLLGLIALDPGPGSEGARNGLVTGTVSLAALATVLGGWGRSRIERAAWLVLAAGIASFALGFAVFFFAQSGLTAFPSPADFFWLGFYPCLVGTIALLARGQRRPARLGISLDAAIVALALAALGYELIFNGLVNVSQASSIVGGQVSYSVLDFAALVMLALVCAPSRLRVGRAYLAIAAGTLLVLAGDVSLAHEIVGGAPEPSPLTYAAWPAGMLAIALAPLLGASLERVRALRGAALYGTIGLSFAVALVLLLQEAMGDRNPVVIALSALVPCAILLRLVAAVRENDRLVRDNEGIIGAAGEGIFRVDLAERVTYVNPAALRFLGYEDEDEVLGHSAHKLFHHTRPNGAPYPAAECPVRGSLSAGATHRVTDELFWRKDRSSIAVDYTSTPIREGGQIVGAVTVFDDVTHQRQMKEQLRHQADHDSLTGLYNRRRLEREVSGQISYAQRYSRPGVLLMMDLDSFKFVNDSYGHPAGDKLLCDAAAIISGTVRETDVVARIGGDEFAVLLREANEVEGVEVAKGLVEAIHTRTAPSVGASVGVAPFDGSGERAPDELLVAADIALYEAKEAGGGGAVVYSGHGGRALTWVERIRDAIDEDRLIVYTQPIVDLATGEEVREELLVRMIDPHGDAIPPPAFLPYAERFGLIQEIDLLVLDRAVDLAKRGRAVAVNVSALTLADGRYLPRLEEALGGGLEPALFNFEITETAAVANMDDAQRFARRIRELGCSLALDDFGTGFSSFTYLKHIPAQFLKIDTEFVHELKLNPADQQLVEAIVAIARGLGQKTVAEGVEDEETMAMVRRLGVDYAQGFYMGRPSPPPQPESESLGLGDGRAGSRDRALRGR